MNQDRVTAVVATHDRLDLLRLTLGSILAQRDVDLDVVVVDEACSDGTTEFLAGLDDPRITVIRHDDPRGPSGARNAAVARATTRWVAICDDDDLWAPTKLRAQLDALAAHPEARWAVAGTVLVDDRLAIIGHRRLPEVDDLVVALLSTNVVPSTAGMVIDRDLYAEVGGFDESIWESEDWDLCIRLAAASPVVEADGPYVAYRIAAGSLSKKTERMRRSFHMITERYGHLAQGAAVEPDAEVYERYLAQQALKSRDRLTASRSYARLAVRGRNPTHAVRATAALLAPATMDRVGDRRAAARVPDEWRAEARRWLDQVTPLGAG